MKDLLFILPGNEERLKKRLGPRKRLFDSTLVSDISALFQEVASSGDRAIKEATERFDRIRIEDIQVSEIYAEKCIDSLTPKFTGAIENAIRNIREVNELLMPEPAWQKEIRPGTIIGEKITPLDSVGLYIPARKGTLVSTALMLVTSAKVAGVGNIVVAMPPQEDGKPNPATVAAARIAGAHRVVSGNGAALVAGMTFGTDSIPEVAGIFGPGPAGIAAAMSVAFSYGKKTMVGIGPTDCAIIADEGADPGWITKNLMCEAEHGPDSSVLLVTTSMELAERVIEDLNARIPLVPGSRRAMLEQVFGPEGMSAITVVQDLESAIGIVDDYAPEHLLIACKQETQEAALSKVRNAGEILLGHNTSFAAANYAIGITAVLPTNGFARAFSGITCRDMVKTSTIGALSEEALHGLQEIITVLGEEEGLPCHADAAIK